MNLNATLIGQTIIFIVFVWFCMKFVWPPIVAIMSERRKKIEDGLLAAEKGAAAENEAKEKADELISQSKSHATEIIANANSQAKNTIEEAKNIAAEEAKRIKDQAIADIEQERNIVANELKNKFSALVMQGVSSVLAKEVDDKTHKDMLSKLTKTL